ncbi:MAG: CU044_2847 family protein [Cyanobacteria bacterium P01_F01_bin.150]
MSQPKLRSIQLDDGTIIKIQVNDAIDSLDPPPTASSSFDSNPELDYEVDTPRSGLPDPTDVNDNYDEVDDEIDGEVRGPIRRAKGWKTSQQSRLPETPSTVTQPTPAQRVGTLVKAYTQDLVKDIRTTALTDVEIEKFTLEFGVSLDTELNAYIASSALECSVKVTIECKLSKSE